MALDLPEFEIRNAKPVCPYFGECGGCSYQDVEYNYQLEAKKNSLEQLLDIPVKMVGSDVHYNYRHRMDYICAWGKVGLRKKGNAKSVVNLGECHLTSPRVSDLLPKIRDWGDELGIEGYNFVRHKGDLRYITSRYAHSSNQLMLIVVTASEETGTKPLIEKLLEHAESVVWAVQPRKGDDSRGEVKEIFGQETIVQKIGNFEFEIGPNCFFQNNLVLIDDMFESILQYVNGYTMDLYCGVGTIGIYASKKASRVIGVDNVEDNINFAGVNAKRNNVNNIEFILDNSNHFLAYYEGDVPDTVIVDPPRDGMAPKFIRKLNRLGAEKIVYVSCNPKTYKRDLELLEPYQLKEVTAFDMFPQTPHAEIVTLLEKK